jgi:RecB family exonuclease
LLLDELRQAVAPALVTEGDRVAAERLLLRLAVNAASERLYVSYPRIEVGEGRARVPSFYALDLLRAATGNIPAHEQLEEQARLAGGAVLSWPAPADPITAIDDVEHDLAVVRRLLDAPDPVAVRGHAHYLLNMSEPLRRSVVERWRRGRDDWSAVDGITRVTPSTEGALTAQRLTARAYSLSALQHFAACPYRFVLASMLRLQPLEEPAPLERMDPRTRGSLLHEIMAALLRQLRHERALPITKDTWPAAADRLDRIIEEVAGRAHEDLAPAVERIWGDDVASLRRDLHGWLGRLVEAGEWVPAYFEYAFGRVPGERDDASSIEPVVLPPGYTLRGAIDLIEMHAGTGELRVTDYKTGRVPDRLDGMVIDGGRVLQPLLYAMAAAQALDRPVVEGRLWYCTVAGNFRTHAVPVDDRTRRTAMEVLEVVDRAVAAGRLMAAPSEGACASCQFQVVCGRDVPRRVARKNPAPLADVHELRSRR